MPSSRSFISHHLVTGDLVEVALGEEVLAAAVDLAAAVPGGGKTGFSPLSDKPWYEISDRFQNLD
jgi:hypothetical protein